MFQWLLKILSFFSGNKVKQLTPPSELSPAEIILEVQDSQSNYLHDFMREAIIEADQERQRQLQNLLDDKKLRTYFQSTIKAVFEKTAKDSGTSFLGAYTCSVPDKAWSVFMEIFTKTCKEMALPITHDGEHLRVEGRQVRAYFEKISPSPVNIDERMRAMLSQGPYR